MESVEPVVQAVVTAEVEAAQNGEPDQGTKRTIEQMDAAYE